MEKSNNYLAYNLVYLRKKSGLKQSDIAKKLNYSDKMVSKWENGDVVPSIEILCTLADIYNISLDKLVRNKIEDQETIDLKNKKRQINNKIIISLLAISVVWILATILFVNLNLTTDVSAWLAFVWAVPVSSIVALVFASLWGKSIHVYIITSVLIWTLIASFYIQFLSYNLFQLFFIGIPAQIVVLLWSRLKIKSNQKSPKNN